MGKDMVYYNLLDSMKNDCCPICELVKKRTLQMMDSFYMKVSTILQSANKYLTQEDFVIITVQC